MAVRSLRVDPPSDDKRWLVVNATMRRLGYHSHALIETLHTVQESFGYVDKDALHFVSESLNIPLSRAYGVTTFYHFFNMKPMGAHTCVVCTGTACHIKGSDEILETIAQAYGVQDGETTADGQLSVMTARCIGACGLAPAVVIDSNVTPKQTTETIVEALERIVDDGV